jgi:hypothetical protein
MDCKTSGLTAATILRTLDTHPGAEWVTIPYRCPFNNTHSSLPLISDRMAERIRFNLPFAASTLEIRILAALCGGKLYQDDLVMLLGGDEDDSEEAIEALHQRGLIALCETHHVRHWLLAFPAFELELRRELDSA